MSLLTSFAMLLLFGSSLQKSRLCDTSDTSLVIDSAVAYTYNSLVKVLLFSGDLVFESEPMDSNANKGSIAAVKSLKDINSGLKAPIDVSYEDSHLLILRNIGSETVWQLYKNFSIDVERNISDIPISIDCFHLSSSLFCLKNGTTIGFHLKEVNSGSLQKFLKQTVDNKPVLKISDEYVSEKCFEGELNGIAVTAAMNRIISGKEYLYMFAGRNLCRQEINQTHWVPMCDIQDIADWIDCPKDDPEVHSTVVSRDDSTEGPEDVSTDGPKDAPPEGPKDGLTDVPEDGSTDGPNGDSTDVSKDGSTDGPKESSTDGRIDGPKEDSFPLLLVIGLALAFIVVVVILLIAFLWIFNSKSNAKLNPELKPEPLPETLPEPKSPQNSLTGTQSVVSIRSDIE